jgi:hypothetical protein
LQILNRALQGRSRGVEEKKIVNPVLGVALHTDKQSLMGYQFGESRVFPLFLFLKPSKHIK